MKNTNETQAQKGSINTLPASIDPPRLESWKAGQRAAQAIAGAAAGAATEPSIKSGGVAKRTLTDSENRLLTPPQKAYLMAHPGMVSLQPNSMLMPGKQLYTSLLHGAVTIDRAMELDEVHKRFHEKQAKKLANQRPGSAHDNYSNSEDTFIERHGMSSRLS